jgi:hypothetical protein
MSFDLMSHRPGILLDEIVDHNMRPGGSELPCDSRADAAARACNKSHSSAEAKLKRTHVSLSLNPSMIAVRRNMPAIAFKQGWLSQAPWKSD